MNRIKSKAQNKNSPSSPNAITTKAMNPNRAFRILPNHPTL
ncbi:MAG TPA: hypothetical protein PK147_05450 [Saprospiraceae bacterium]|nr:hypothetical protein [Saprospiraceae bacterium]HPQ21273.1 hypothetical protein [Saprospiraceae bacterium]HRX30179.1 hypothetical protein [Saprospiraceae bacterium]